MALKIRKLVVDKRSTIVSFDRNARVLHPNYTRPRIELESNRFAGWLRNSPTWVAQFVGSRGNTSLPLAIRFTIASLLPVESAARGGDK